MKCTNPIPCDGEMKPLTHAEAPQFTECMKCGFRIDTPKEKTVPKPVSTVPTDKGENK